MRNVNESELSVEQKTICYAPSEGTILVVGPPGSGKTVVALHRANGLARREEPHDVVVYNHVLKNYTGGGATFYKWLRDWWYKCTRIGFPSSVIYVEKNGRSYRNKQNDYDAAMSKIRSEGHRFRTNGHWGHLILDEAQDFPPKAHTLLCQVRTSVFGDQEATEQPSLMILADENQRLTDQNSTITQIKSAHILTDEETYLLTKNYRNTREIAEFAATFYVGLVGGIPELPDRRGEKPLVRKTDGINEAVKQIARWALAHENQEIGVLTFYNNTRRSLFNKLEHRLNNSGIRVQTYSSDTNDPNNDATNLRFDEGRTITILCFASSKGLEFDTVFLPELQSFPVDAGSRDEARMNLYVMASRARKNLFLSITDSGEQAGIWRLLPDDAALYRMER